MDAPVAGPTDYLNLKEVAALLRLKERKLYDLVREGRIPCVKVTGKWLFPRTRIEAWIAGAEVGGPGPQPAARPPAARPPAIQAPPIVAGSRDPLLDWAIAESGCGLATLGGGSLAGLAKLRSRDALVAGIHLLDAASGDYNLPFLDRAGDTAGKVLLEWARREQGLVVKPGNPLGLATAADILSRRVVVAMRQPEAGAHLLLSALLARAGGSLEGVATAAEVCQTGLDVGLAVLDGRADCGLALRAVARRLHLDFVPLVWERFDLLLDRRDYFEPPMQALLAFCRTPALAAKAADLQGYDLSTHGTVHFNGA